MTTSLFPFCAEEFEERDLEGQPDSLAEAAQASAAPAQEAPD